MKIATEVLVIGAGSAGLSALRQVQKYTSDYRMVDHGPLGTTCARTGCMPSKVLISIARDFHRRNFYESQGILGGESLRCNLPRVLERVRSLRDQFAGGMEKSTLKLAGEKLIRGTASFLTPNEIQVGDDVIKTGRTIIATGSKPVFPEAWLPFRDKILTSENFFEQEDLQGRIGVIGLGAIGLELGQALSRLGLEVTGFDMLESIGGLTDPEVQKAAGKILGEELPLYLGAGASVYPEGDGLRVEAGEISIEVDKIIASLGVVPNVGSLGLEKLGVPLDRKGLPSFNPRTMQVEDLPVFIGGDVNGCRPILHEALDEGFIAGRNAGQNKAERYCRRIPAQIVFTDPSIAIVGAARDQLPVDSFVTGSADFSRQSRARIEERNSGILHLYADKSDGRLLGSEMLVPDAEHLAHQFGLALQHELTVHELLQMPYYHPTIEEGLRTALRDAAGKIKNPSRHDEMALCESSPEDPLC